MGVSWEQANAFCVWRTNYLLAGLRGQARYIQRYRLPTEAEWEFAARGLENNYFPWKSEDTKDENGCYSANYKPGKGNYTLERDAHHQPRGQLLAKLQRPLRHGGQRGRMDL